MRMAGVLSHSSRSDEKDFDAFVSYAKSRAPRSEVPSRVSEELLALVLFPEVLENKYGFTLCLLDRDVAPGGGRCCLGLGKLHAPGRRKWD